VKVFPWFAATPLPATLTTNEGLGWSPGLGPVVQVIYVEVTVLIAQGIPSIVTVVEPLTKLVPAIVISSPP